jgi:hypothetical protein
MNVSNAPATLFSPAKLVYIGYVVLAGLDRIPVSAWQFIIISLAFLAVQIWHDDYYRIVLNRRAEARER